MWKPAERIRHDLPEPGWPTAEEAARSRLFSPLRVGAVELERRTWVPAMVPWRATEDGHVTDDLLAWYERFARETPKMDKAPEALQDAVVLRLGLGQEKQAIDDADLFNRNYGQAKPAQTSTSSQMSASVQRMTG